MNDDLLALIKAKDEEIKRLKKIVHAREKSVMDFKSKHDSILNDFHRIESIINKGNGYDNDDEIHYFHLDKQNDLIHLFTDLRTRNEVLRKTLSNMCNNVGIMDVFLEDHKRNEDEKFAEILELFGIVKEDYEES